MGDFKDKCYRLLKQVPYGKVITYKEIALALNSRAFRAVGTAMRKNENRDVPCYKVVKSNGEIGGFNRGRKEKIRLLRKEGIKVKNGKIDLERFGWKI